MLKINPPSAPNQFSTTNLENIIEKGKMNIENKIWQIIFIEDNRDNEFLLPSKSSSTNIIAFCPFTKILSNGSSIQHAMKNWIQEATKEFGYQPNTENLNPKRMSSRKIWCSEYHTKDRSKFDIFVISNKIQQSHHTVALCPEKRLFVESFDSNVESLKKLPKQLYSKINSNVSESREGCWFDDSVVCTPIMVLSRENNDN
eukprot:TRINITY_DN432_c0_g1_i1.p1 TRINITY_DN432_c0_g1~~TRINITY_DN432_c0_g1_i1.p1  ORF type:complete len:201 (-),score=39.11 TRINITY_DN432_c0_g1_i1:115-717(-)